MNQQSALGVANGSDKGWRFQYSAIAACNLALLTGLAVLGPIYTILSIAVAVIAVSTTLSSIGIPLFLALVSHVSTFQGEAPVWLYQAKLSFLLGLFGLLLIRILAAPQEFQYVRSSIDREYLIFLAWGAFCSIFATDPLDSLKETLRLATFLPIFIATRSVIRNERHLHLIAAAAAIAILFNGIVSGYEYSILGFHRIRGLFVNANFLAMFLMFATPMVVIGLLASRRIWMKMIFTGAAFLGASLLLLSWSRAAILGSSVALITYLILERQKRFLLAILAFALLASITLLVIPQTRNTLSLVLRLEAGTTHRTTLWSKSFEGIERSPIVGLGYNVSRAEAGGRINWNNWEETILFGNTKAPFYPHNLYLYTLVTIGIPGLILLLRLYWKLMRDQRDSWLEAKSPAQRQVHRIVFAVVLGSLFHGLFESGNIIHYISWASYFWMLLAMSVAIRARGLLLIPSQTG